MLFLLMFVGILGTIPHLKEYGINALRDAALWGYSIFALLTASFLLNLKSMWDVVYVYRRWIPWLLFWIPVVMIFYHTAIEIIPRWPASNVPIINPKPGDMAVHLSGAAAFLVLGLYRFEPLNRHYAAKMKEWLLWCMLLIGCVTIFTGRAAILTVVSTLLLIVIIRPFSHWAKPTVLFILIAVGFIALDMKVSIVENRFVSPEALIQTIKSIFDSTGVIYYDGPRQWRIDWWSEIFKYTFLGEYFWTGKGYGINLANSDGFQVFHLFSEQSLRSPHNSHLTFLARSGVPGFLIWIALQGIFAISLFKAYNRAVRYGRRDWAALNLWVIAYWFAFMVNASFDVFLEGPQGGIWFWCLFGFGTALIEIQRQGIPSSL